MPPNVSYSRFWAIGLFAVLTLCSVVVLIGQHIAPQVPTLELLLICAGLVLGVVMLVLVSWIVGQVVLHAGGTDPQWFWFDSKPPGLNSLRHRQRTPRSQRF